MWGTGAVLGYAMASSDGLRYVELCWAGGMGALAGWWRRAEIKWVGDEGTIWPGRDQWYAILRRCGMHVGRRRWS